MTTATGGPVRDTDETTELRDRMVATLQKDGAIGTEPVADAMQAVPRHLFLPDTTPGEAYRPFTAVVTRRDARGAAISSVSSPQVQAVMAEQADLRPGMRVLEIGSGGYNAALLAQLVGPTGHVTTVDIDVDVVGRARHLLDATGNQRVRVVHGDAEHGVPGGGAYDRIVVTTGAWDLPPAWTGQLAPAGRIVVPLRMRGLTRTLALDATGDPRHGHLLARSARLFGFVPVQGDGAHPPTVIRGRDGEVTLTFDDDPHPGPDVVGEAFTGERAGTWSGVRVGRHESLDTLQMWLATVAPGFCFLRVDPDLDTGLITLPRRRSGALACLVGGTLAHLTTRPTHDDEVAELGADAHGPQADALAEMLTRHLRTWDAQHRGGPGPQVRLYPAATPDRDLAPGHVIDKRHRRVVLSWPDHPTTTAEASGW